MNKKSSDQAGFAVTEVIILVLILLIIGGTLWYINASSKSNKNSIDKAVQKTTTSPNPSAKDKNQ